MNIHKNALDGARSTLAGAAGRGTRLADGGSGQGGRHIAAARLSLVGTLRHHGIGWEALHVCIDDATRLGYSEILPDERKGSAVGFLERALGWFAQHGVTVERLMTDNGSAYLSQDFRGSRRARPQTQTHQAVHAAHQRESRAVYPNQFARVGPCPSLPNLAGAHRGVGTLA